MSLLEFMQLAIKWHLCDGQTHSSNVSSGS
jgi:hypothetical protein